ncbi:MAG: hypothetical protein HY290_00425 [Planctomycetia bacterium]|nr:hypothetical protein [Planctomycetia bacterium]
MGRLMRAGGLWAGAGLLIVVAARHAPAQEFMPDPAQSQARSANLANGGTESEWEYHRRANSANFRPTIRPISKFAGGSGYCTPVCRPAYYGRSGCGCR